MRHEILNQVYGKFGRGRPLKPYIHHRQGVWLCGNVHFTAQGSTPRHAWINWLVGQSPSAPYPAPSRLNYDLRATA